MGVCLLEGKQKWGVAVILFFIVIMVFSSLALLVLDEAPQGPPAQPPDSGGGTQISFVSEPFEASVSDVFPQLTLIGATENLLIGEIDSEISRVEVVKSLSSRYVLNQPSLSPYGYAADITLERGASPKEFFDKVASDTNFLTSLDGVVQGLVELPSEVIVMNPELEIDRNYSPESHFGSANLSVHTLEGDRVMVQLLVDFSNETPSNQQIFETSNLTSEPQTYTLDETLEISGFGDRLSVRGSFDSGSFIAPPVFEERMEGLGFEMGDSRMGQVPEFFVLSSSHSLGGDGISDLNSAIVQRRVEGLDSFSINPDENGFQIVIVKSEGADSGSVVSTVKEIAGEQGVPQASFSFEEPSAPFSVELLLNGKSASEAKGLVESAVGVDVNALKEVVFEKPFLSVPGEGKEFAVPGGEIRAFVSLERSVGEIVSLELFVVIVRGEISSVAGEEKGFFS